MLSVARQMRARAGRRGGLRNEWRPLGVEVVQARLAASGTCVERDGRRRLYVAAGEPAPRQRFTAAHEAAHLLLAARMPRELSRRQEERLCDEFASEYLIGRAPLVRALVELGLPHTPDDVLRLCGRFNVNVQPMLLALRGPLAEEPLLIIASRWRGHPGREWEFDMRVDAAVGPRRLFVPTDQRLRSLGLDELADWSVRAALHSCCDGHDLAQVAPRRVAERVWPGEVTWRARMQGLRPRFVLAVIDVNELVTPPQVPLALAA